jgi:hypothetical protein
VDVLATYTSGQPHTETVVEAVPVLFVLSAGAAPPGALPGAVSDAAASGIAAGPVLLLVVSPDQQQRLAYASAFANLAVSIDPALSAAPVGAPSG